MNLATLAEQSLERLGERMGLDFEGEKITNLQTLERARRVQAALEELGFGKGGVAVLFMINHPMVYPIFQGVYRSGGTAVPVMFQLTAPEIQFILADTRAEVVFTDSTVLFKVLEAVKGLDHVRHIIVRGGKDNPSAVPPQHSLEALMERDPKSTLPQIDPHDTAIMLYTSGTTGKPKGVMLSHANLIAMAEAANEAAELDKWEGPRIGMSAMPMGHIFGVGVMNSGYLVPKHLADAYTVQMQWFQPEPFMKHIHTHRCTTMASVPTMLSLLLNHPKNAEYDMSSLKEVVCGAAPLPVELARAFMARYDCRVREIYGMTENAGIGTANRISEPYRPGSAGRAYFNNQIRIVDENGLPVPTGERGEVCTRGPANMKGYHNRPEATREVLRDGWLHSGDIGYLDAEGHLFIVDRKKDMIIRGGENIYPAELEDVLYRHPSIAEAAVVGIPDPTYGETVIAFVVPKKDVKLTGREVIDFMLKNVTAFKVPSRVHFLEALPKVGVGKILRRELRQKAAEMETAASGPPA